LVSVTATRITDMPGCSDESDVPIFGAPATIVLPSLEVHT